MTRLLLKFPNVPSDQHKMSKCTYESAQNVPMYQRKMYQCTNAKCTNVPTQMSQCTNSKCTNVPTDVPMYLRKSDNFTYPKLVQMSQYFAENILISYPKQSRMYLSMVKNFNTNLYFCLQDSRILKVLGDYLNFFYALIGHHRRTYRS